MRGGTFFHRDAHDGRGVALGPVGVVEGHHRPDGAGGQPDREHHLDKRQRQEDERRECQTGPKPAKKKKGREGRKGGGGGGGVETNARSTPTHAYGWTLRRALLRGEESQPSSRDLSSAPRCDGRSKVLSSFPWRDGSSGVFSHRTSRVPPQRCSRVILRAFPPAFLPPPPLARRSFPPAFLPPPPLARGRCVRLHA